MILYCFATPNPGYNPRHANYLKSSVLDTSNLSQLRYERDEPPNGRGFARTVTVCDRCGHDVDPEEMDEDHLRLDQEFFRQAFRDINDYLVCKDPNIEARQMFNLNDDRIDDLAVLLVRASRGVETYYERTGH